MGTTNFNYQEKVILSRPAKATDSDYEAGGSVEISGKTYKISSISHDPTTGNYEISLS